MLIVVCCFCFKFYFFLARVNVSVILDSIEKKYIFFACFNYSISCRIKFSSGFSYSFLWLNYCDISLFNWSEINFTFHIIEKLAFWICIFNECQACPFFTVCWFFHPLTLETIPMMLAYQIGQLLKSFSIKLTKLGWLLNSMIPNIRWVLLCWMTLDIIRLFNVSYHVKEIESTTLDDKSITPSSYSYFGHFTELFTGFLLDFYF